MSHEPSTTINSTVQDAVNQKEFLKHFKVDAPKLLEVCDEIIAANTVTLITQNKLRLAICETYTTSGHPMFKDELFEDIITNSKAALQWWEDNATPAQKRWEVDP